MRAPSVLHAFVALGALGAAACFGRPDTRVVLTNAYDPGVPSSPVVYRAAWLAVTFDGDVPLAPGASTPPEFTVPASGNTAYVLLAPGWDPASSALPTSFLVLQSRAPYAVHFDDALTIAVNDASFRGDCDGGSALSQDEADFITRHVFADVFAGLSYDAASCRTTALASPDASTD